MIKQLLSIAVVACLLSYPAAATAIVVIRTSDRIIVDGGVTQSFATYIVYQDATKKQNVIDALCDLGNYDALDPATRPSRQNFANNEIKNWLREKVRANRERLAQATVPPVDTTDLP